MSQILLSLAQLAVAVVLSAIAAYLAFYLFQWFTRNLDEWEELRQGNPAVGIVVGAILISVAIVLQPALSVSTDTWDVGGDLFFRVLLAEALQLAVGLVLAVITLALALYLFAGLTRGIDEVEEIKNGNLAVASLLAGVVIGVGLLVSQAMAQIMTLVSSALF
jgi:putative membrane protein